MDAGELARAGMLKVTCRFIHVHSCVIPVDDLNLPDLPNDLGEK